MWHESDSFWDEHAPQMFHAKRWERTPGEVDGALSILALTPGAAVLDLPCGPGRHSLELARRGFRVTGVDRTPAYLDRARSLAREQYLSVEWVQADMRAFSRPHAFDAAINMYTSLGYFRDAAENQRVLANFRSALRRGGSLLIDVLGKEVLARTFKERTWERRPDDSLYLCETSVGDNWSWVQSRWVVVRGGAVREDTVSHYVYSAVELIDMLTRAGFHECRTFGSLAGTPYDHNAERLIIAARAG